MRRTVREGSIADKCIKACNWIDNSRLGNVIGAFVLGVAFFALTMYGFQCTHPFM